MADFCKQCSIEYFGEDFRDLADLGGPDAVPLEPDHGYGVICEGCGFTLVDNDGRCISTECMKKHNAVVPS